MARCNGCFVETPKYWHTLHGHYCSEKCAERAAGITTIELTSLLQSDEDLVDTEDTLEEPEQ